MDRVYLYQQKIGGRWRTKKVIKNNKVVCCSRFERILPKIKEN